LIYSVVVNSKMMYYFRVFQDLKALLVIEDLPDQL